MFLARVFFFRLYESPRYLVHAGRPEDAVISLQKISEFNGDSLIINLADVEDSHLVPGPDLEAQEEEVPETVLIADTPLDYSSTTTQPDQTTIPSDNPSGSDNLDLHGERETDPFLDVKHSDAADTASIPTAFTSVIPVYLEMRLPKMISRPLNGWLFRVKIVLSGEWRRTTLLIWWIWFSISLGRFPVRFRTKRYHQPIFKLSQCLTYFYPNYLRQQTQRMLKHGEI